MSEMGDVVARDAEQEIAELVGSGEDLNDEAPPTPAAAAKKARGRRRGSSGVRAQSRTEDDQGDVEVGDQEVEELIQSAAPRPVKEQKTLGDLYAKWGVPRPDFKVQVWRLMPKFYPGGAKADGFYDEYQNALYEEDLLREYGGGTLMVKIVGPNKTDPRHTQPYESMQVELSGEPNYERRPRAAKPAERVMPAPQTSANDENPRLAEKALTLISGQADQERAERHRVEDRAAAALGAAHETIAPLVDAERRRADDVMTVERAAAADRERHLNERLEEQRAKADALERKVNEVMMGQPSAATTIREIAEVLKPGESGQMAERMLKDVLEKHRTELEANRASHQREIDSLRTSHQSEVTSIRSNHAAETNMLREAHQRDLEAERASGKRREERLEDQVKQERDERDRRVKMEQEERERDRSRNRELLDEKDRTWKERMTAAELAQKQQAEATYSIAVNNYESRISRLEEDLSRLRTENTELKAKVAEVGDAVSIVKRGEEIKDALGIKPPAEGAGGGIGLTPTDDWKTTLAETAGEKIPELMDKLPMILQALFGGGAQQQQAAPQQPQHQVGQMIRLPDGREMIVVPNPAAGPGALGMTPREAYEKRQGRAPTRQLPAGRPVGPATQAQPRRKRPRREAVTNYAEGLPPLPRPPWEEGDDDGDVGMMDAAPAAAPMQSQPQTAAPPPPPPAPVEKRELTAQERMVLNELAKLVHDAVSHGEEPEELVAKMGQYPAAVVQQIAQYAPEQVAAGVKEVQPSGAGSSPEGQRFILQAMTMLRHTLSQS